MDAIEKYEFQPISQTASDIDQSPGIPLPVVLAGLARRWRIVLLTSVLVIAVGIPLLWLSMKPYYQATAAIRVTPTVSSILFQGENNVPMYRNFVRTQADLMTSDMVLERVARDLAEQNILPEKDVKARMRRKAGLEEGPIAALKQMVIGQTLRVREEDSTELIKITMRSSNPQEAAAVVNTFLKAYMALVASEETRGDDDKLAILENEARSLSEKLQKEREAIGDMTRQYGTASLTPRQQMKLDRISALQGKITEFEMQKIGLQIREQLLTSGNDAEISPQEIVRLRYDFVNNDLVVRTLTANAAQLEQELISARQLLAPANPELARRTEMIQILNERLDHRREEVGRNFDEMVEKEAMRKDADRLASVQTQLRQIDVYQTRLQEILSTEDEYAIELGRRQLAIDDLTSQSEMTRELHDAVLRRIQEVEVERKRPGRITSAYFANTAPLQDKRKKYSLALMFGAVGLGMALGILRNRYDLSMYTPADVKRSAGVRLLGTTSRLRDVEEAFLPEHYMNDYQNICANLGLIDESGIPPRILITSPHSKDGKTTLAINLAATLARMGKKVLLVDGDLRKADIAFMMKLWGASSGLKHVLLGEPAEKYICHTSIQGFDLLPSNPCEPSMIYNLMNPMRLKNALDDLSLAYDHVIVDTPPAMEVPDTYMWARAVDAVILTAWSGNTRSTDLKETLARFEQMDANVLGLVLNNVAQRQGYNAFSCYTESTSGPGTHPDGPDGSHLLPLAEDDEDAYEDQEDGVEVCS